MSSIQLINTGTFANDTTGDPLQTAFNKINANFNGLSGNTPVIIGPPVTPPGGTTITVVGASAPFTGSVMVINPANANQIALDCVYPALAYGAASAVGAITLSQPGTGTQTGSIVNIGDGTNFGFMFFQNAGYTPSEFSGGPTGLAFLLGSNNAAMPISLGNTSHEAMRVAGAGNVTINAPTSGTALTVNELAAGGVPSASFVGPGTVPLSMQEFGAVPSASLNAYIGIGLASFPGSSGINGDLILSPRTSANCNINFCAGGANRAQLTGSGNFIIAAPSSGATLTANATGTANALSLVSSTASASLIFGYQIVLAGAWGLASQGTDGLSLGTVGATALQLFTNNSSRFTINSAGNVTINAPTSGNAFTVQGVAGAANFAAQIAVPNTASNSFGLVIFAGTNSSDISFRANNAANTLNFLTVFGDGGVTVGAPVGGDKGAGTINCTGLFVNGVAVTVP